MVKKSFLAFIVFAIFFTIVLFVYTRSSALFTEDDPYYHAYRAEALWQGVPYSSLDLPVYSTLRTKPATFYVIYYYTMAPFMAGFTGSNYQALIAGSKLYHELLVGFLYVIFFAVALEVLRIKRYAFAATLFLFIFSSMFSFRSLLERPHLISIIVVLLAYVYTVRKKPWAVFLVNVISPFTYSVSFFSIVPGVVYGILFRKWRYFFASIGGLIVGILIRPDAWNYVYNGFGFHLVSLLHSTLLGQPGPAEFGAGNWPLSAEPWLLIYVAVLGYAAISWLMRKERSKEYSMSWSEVGIYTLVLSFIFYIPFIFVQRSVEYTVPFAVLAIFVVIVDHLLPFMKSCKEVYEIPTDIKPFARHVIYTSRQWVARLYKVRKWWVVFFVVILVVCGLAQVMRLAAISRNAAPMAPIQQAAEYLKTHASPKDIVFYQDFAIFSRLIFFNHQSSYIVGVDSVFMYAFDQQKYWIWAHATRNEPVTVAELRDELKVSYVLFDHSSDKDIGSFEEGVRDGKDFELVFKDALDLVRIYRLKAVLDK